MKGLEPPLLTEPDPKSGASTNSATSANCGAKVAFFLVFIATQVSNCQKIWILTQCEILS